MTFDPVAFAQWMNIERISQAMSLRKMETATGIPNNTLSYIERKSRDLTVGNFCAICAALDADPCAILELCQK